MTPIWRTTLGLGLLSAVFTAGFRGMDNYTVHNLIIARDELTAAFAYLIIGAWTGVALSIPLSIVLGRRILDPEFGGFVIRNRRLHAAAIATGLLSAASTLFILWGNQYSDPSVLIALSSLVLVYTIFYEVTRGRISLRKVGAPALLAIIGGILASASGSVKATIIGLLLVLVLSNGLDAVSNLLEREGTLASDGVNFFVWRFFWLAVFGTAGGFLIAPIRGTTELLFSTIAEGINVIPVIMVTMVLVFFGMGFKFVAQKGGGVSVVLIVRMSTIILGYPITFLGYLVAPGAFGELPTDISIWLVRLLGAVLIVLGIWRLKNYEY